MFAREANDFLGKYHEEIMSVRKIRRKVMDRQILDFHACFVRRDS